MHEMVGAMLHNIAMTPMSSAHPDTASQIQALMR